MPVYIGRAPVGAAACIAERYARRVERGLVASLLLRTQLCGRELCLRVELSGCEEDAGELERLVQELRGCGATISRSSVAEAFW